MNISAKVSFGNRRIGDRKALWVDMCSHISSRRWCNNSNASRTRSMPLSTSERIKFECDMTPRMSSACISEGILCVPNVSDQRDGEKEGSEIDREID